MIERLGPRSCRGNAVCSFSRSIPDGIQASFGYRRRPYERKAKLRIFQARAEKEVRCYVNEEGHLVCDRLEPGDYLVKGAAPSTSGKKANEEGVAVCYITDTGELLCEGLPTGHYTIEKADERQMLEIVERMDKLVGQGESLPKPTPISEDELKLQQTYDPETGVFCHVNAEGVMVCEKLEPGDYKVRPMPEGVGSKLGEAQNNEGVTFCYITDDGELICEGMEEGTYKIEKATDDDLSAMVKHVERITDEVKSQGKSS